MSIRSDGLVIGIDGSRLSVVQRTGTENYTAHIIVHLAEIAAPDTLRVYLRTPDIPGMLRNRPEIEPVPIPFRRLWTHWRLSQEMVRRPPDVLFVPAHVVPVAHPRTVVTIHDLGYLHHPESHPPGQRRMLDLTTRWSVHAARHVIAISEATRHDLSGAYNVPLSKITVVPHGVGVQGQVGQQEAAEVRQRLGLPERFVLTVGTIQPRKNLPRLAEAMNQVAAAGLPHKLVVAGKPGWMANDVLAAVARADRQSRVVNLGYVSESDLRTLYALADGFVLPSLYEGFGMPALDALAIGLPTVLSDRSSLPEVGGDAAIYVNPMDVGDIGRALVRVLTDTDLWGRLARLGPIQAGRFSWKAAAEATLGVLRTATS